MQLELNYYYGQEAEQYSFYRIPKLLFTEKQYGTISMEAKILYGFMLDRMDLSRKNGWLDQEGRVYIIYTVAEVMESIGCAEQKAIKLLSELDEKKGIGLIEKKRLGLGKPNVLYVKDFSSFSQVKNNENQSSGKAKITRQEFRKSQGNHTEFSQTENSSLKFNPIYLENQVKSEQREEDGIEEMEQYRKRIQQNISYDRLIQDNPGTKKTIDGLIELMLEVVCSKRSCIRLNQEEKPKEIVKSRFLKLENEHIHYVLDCLRKNTTKIGNIKSYLLSCLYNSVDTIEQYYSSRVQHDWGSPVWCGS